MAKAHGKTHQSKLKSSLFLCCFESLFRETSMESNHNPRQKIRWFSWRMIRMKNSATKTVPLDVCLSDHEPPPKRRADQVHSSKWKSKSKSNSHKFSLVKTQTSATNLAPPSQTPPVVPFTPNQPPPQTRHKHRPLQNHADNLENRKRSHRVTSPEEDMRQQSSSSPAMSHSVHLPTSKRQIKCLSSMSMHNQTTLNQPKWLENPRRYDPVVGMSAVLVTLIIMTLWGRLCAIFCTSAWLYFIPRFTTTLENDTNNLNTYSNNLDLDLDLDSKVYKKKVILEGLLERNHRGRSENSCN